MTSLLHLVDRAARGALLPAEAQQLRDGIRALLENAAAHAAVRPTGGPEHPPVADDMPDGARGAMAGVQDRECRCHNRQGLTAEQHENDCPFACPGHPEGEPVMSARDEAVEMIRRICPSHLSADKYGEILAEKFDAYRAEILHDAADDLDEDDFLLAADELRRMAEEDMECPCASGSPEQYEGPLRDCPIHGEHGTNAEAEAELARVRDAAALHRQGLFSTTELYAVIGPALDTPAPTGTTKEN